MATTDAGLEKLTLQTSYQKLVIGALDTGLAGDMSMVTTSLGQSAAVTPLYIGSSGDGGSSIPLVKIKAGNSTGKFFSIANKSGDEKIGEEGGGSERQIMSFDSDSGVEGRAVVWQKLQIKTLGESMGVGGRIEFVQGENASTLSKYPNIHGANAGSNIQFETGSDAITAWWTIDRLRIAAGDESANYSPTPVTPAFDATGITCTLGATTTQDLTSSGNYIHNGTAFTVDTSANVDITAQGDCLIDGYGTARFRAEGISGNEATLYLDAISTDADTVASNLLIGTANTPGDYGAKSITIGNINRTNGTLTINSYLPQFTNGFISLKAFASGQTKGSDSGLIPDGYSTLYCLDDTSQLPWWFDSSNDKNYSLELLESGKSRTPIYEDVDTTTTAVPDTPTNGSVVQYIKNNFLIWKYQNTVGGVVYHSIDLESIAGTQSVAYATSEPS